MGWKAAVRVNPTKNYKQATWGAPTPCGGAIEGYSCLDQIVCLGRSRFLSVKRALGGFVAPFRGVVMVVVWWVKVVTTPPDLDLVGAGPVGSHHGSYRCVRYRGGQIWGGTWGSARAASMVMAPRRLWIVAANSDSDMFNGPNTLNSRR